MKRLVIPAIFTAIGATLAIYISDSYLAGNDIQVASSGKPDLTGSQIEREGNKNLEDLVEVIADLKTENQALMNRLDEKLTGLNKRVSELENSEASTQKEDTEHLDYQYNGNIELTERGFAQWLESSLSTTRQNDEKVNRISNETFAVLSKNLPGVNLDNMACNEGYCRASFSHVNGEKPETRKLFGEPPFMGQGFTIEEPDGRVLLYFTEAGQTLADLKQEANIAAQMGFIEH